MSDADQELLRAMRRYIAEGLESVRQDRERIAAIRRELAELGAIEETRVSDLDVSLY